MFIERSPVLCALPLEERDAFSKKLFGGCRIAQFAMLLGE